MSCSDAPATWGGAESSTTDGELVRSLRTDERLQLQQSLTAYDRYPDFAYTVVYRRHV
jgi:hypothetical protein